MNVRKSIAGAILASSLLLGGATAATAASATPTVPTTLTPAQCKTAAHKLHELKIVEAHLKADYARAVKVRDAAAKAGKTELVKVLDAKLAKARAANAVAVARVKALAAEIRTACTPVTPAT